MNKRFLDFYNTELQHLREMGGEFSQEFPKIASRLSLDEFGCADPYVERLIESFAFLAARVHYKLDADFPRFTQSLLDAVYPQYQTPTPSIAIVQFQPNLNEADLADGFSLPRGTSLHSVIGKGDKTTCEFRTAHELVLWPLQIVEAEYHTLNLSTLELPVSVKAKAAIRIRLKTAAGLTFSRIGMDSITFYLRGINDELAMRLYEQFFTHGAAIVIQTRKTGKRTRSNYTISADNIRQVGFSKDQSLFPYDHRVFDGYRLLREYFAYPKRFMFVEISGLNEILRQCKTEEVDLNIPMREIDYELEGNVNTRNFSLFCTPAINLFPKQTNRIQISNQFSEFHVVADRTRPLDFEIYQILTATGYGVRSDQQQEFLPLFSVNDIDREGQGAGAYFSIHRTRRLTPKTGSRVRPQSQYLGSEIYISLVDSQEKPFDSELRELSISTLCTNRDLPLHMPTGLDKGDFTMDTNAPVVGLRCLHGPSPPISSNAEAKNNWRVISHLSLNYLSLLESNDKEGASALRDLLALYADTSNLQVRNQLGGITSLRSHPITRRIPSEGPIAFGRGLEVFVTLDESAFRGSGIFLLGAVLERFFTQCISVNSFVETVIESIERGEIKRWSTRSGLRPIL